MGLNKAKLKRYWKKTWWFIWEDTSVWSWIVNILLAFILIKFIVYPGLGLVLGTSYPVVAVVSSSMEHSSEFNEWWALQGDYYKDFGINQNEFKTYIFKNGFNKGDIIVLKGVKPENVKLGDVLVFSANRRDPIIHRVIKSWKEGDVYYFQTKGDNNQKSIDDMEIKIHEDKIIGKSVFRIPFLGYVKIGFVSLLKLAGVG